MEQPTLRGLQDCYFFYYSSCSKGPACSFRHEPSALGHEEVCKLFLEGKCFNPKCSMRHMKIQKPRKDTPCYWEQQPTGCRKAHCVFQHRNPRPGTAAAAVPPTNAILQMPPSGGIPGGMPPAGGLILLPRIL